MTATHSELPELVRQLSWTQASLDLCLDMERNQSDTWFAAQSDKNEIIYVFDESVFELFVGGLDEPPAGSVENSIYFDRRRSVGIFNVHEWREKPRLDDADEKDRISLNRQSAILTTEWLFSGTLPAMERGRGLIHISRGHLQELRARWEVLVTHYRKLIRGSEIASEEQAAVKALLEDRAALALDHNGYSSAKEVEKYLAAQPKSELKSDLQEFWASLIGHEGLDERSKTRSFWRYAFSRRLADELANIRAIGPLAQLVRINTEIAGRLRLLDHAGDIDTPADIPNSERQPFWNDRINEEVERRERFGIRVDRSRKTRNNDAATLASVQALANSAIRQNLSKRYVFVTADSFIIDVYRAWHCHSALNFEPFVIRPVRHFAPLLNVANMADEVADSSEETRKKRDIFPALQAAINPFLLTLNLSRRTPRKVAGQRKAPGDADDNHADDDSKRWPREMFALHLKRILQEYRRGTEGSVRGNEDWLRGQIADLRFFTSGHLERLKDAEAVLSKLSEGGRQIERSAIGLGLPRLGAKLDGLKIVADVLDNLVDRDETALASYIQDMVDEFGSANLMLQAQSLSIADDLLSVVAANDFAGLSHVRVPLTLALNFIEKGKTLSVEDEALRLVNQAVSEGARPKRGKRSGSFDLDLQGSTLASDGGHRLFALFACVALRLSRWDSAQRHAAEAHYRVTKFLPDDINDGAEVSYLLAITSRFQIGTGPVLDTNGFDVTEQRYERAAQLLQGRTDDQQSKLDTFVEMRAASELVALNIFVSIWSLARSRFSGSDYPKLPRDIHLKLLPESWALARQLRNCIFQGVDSSNDRPLAKDFVELSEQVIANASAIFALARVARGLGSEQEVDLILSDDEMTEWLDDDEPTRPVGEAYPPITAFYRYWYQRARDRNRDEPIKHFSLDLPVDLTAQRLFQFNA